MVMENLLKKYMESLFTSDYIHDEEKLKQWSNAFVFPTKLNDFIQKLRDQLTNKDQIPADVCSNKLMNSTIN